MAGLFQARMLHAVVASAGIQEALIIAIGGGGFIPAMSARIWNSHLRGDASTVR